MKMDNSIIVSEWNSDAFHRRVLTLEASGYVARQETYRITPEMNPETGSIIHLHRIEMTRAEESVASDNPGVTEDQAVFPR